MVMRSDYQILQVNEIELKFRSLLEKLLTFRPRFKEFLFGYPFLMLGLWTNKRYLIYLGLIGEVSVINTFIHIHTPFHVSLLRTLLGIIIGILLGLIFIRIYERRNSLKILIFDNLIKFR